MAKSLLSKNDFTWGELGEKLLGRVDLPEYRGGVKKLVNFDIAPQGPLSRRQGMDLVTQVPRGSGLPLTASRLIAFEFSREIGFIVIATPQFFTIVDRVTDDVVGGVDTPFLGTDIPNLQWVTYGNSMYFTDGRNKPQILTRTSGSSFTLSEHIFQVPPTTGAYHPVLVSVQSGNPSNIGASVIYDASSRSVSEADTGRFIIDNAGGQGLIKGVNVNNPTSPSITVEIQKPMAETGLFTLLGNPGYYLDISATGLAVGNTITIAFKDPNDPAGDDIDSVSIGNAQYIELNGGFVKSTGFPGYPDEWQIISALDTDDSTYSAAFYVEEFSDVNTPKAVSIFNGRLCYGGTSLNPQRIWLSRSGLFDDFTIGIAPDDAIQLDLVTTKGNSVQWMAPSDNLIVGCVGAEVVVRQVATNALSSTNIEQRTTTKEGSYVQQPLLVDNSVVFIQSGGKKVLSYGYDFQSDSQNASDLTLLNEDIAETTFIEMAYSASPQKRLYGTTATGDLKVLTFTGQLGGWTTYETEGSISSVATLPSTGRDKVYCLVARGSEGSNTLNLEVLDTQTTTDILTPFIDSAKTGNKQAFKLVDGTVPPLDGSTLASITDLYVNEQAALGDWTTHNWAWFNLSDSSPRGQSPGSGLFNVYETHRLDSTSTTPVQLKSPEVSSIGVDQSGYVDKDYIAEYRDIELILYTEQDFDTGAGVDIRNRVDMLLVVDLQFGGYQPIKSYLSSEDDDFEYLVEFHSDGSIYTNEVTKATGGEAKVFVGTYTEGVVTIAHSGDTLFVNGSDVPISFTHRMGRDTNEIKFVVRNTGWNSPIVNCKVDEVIFNQSSSSSHSLDAAEAAAFDLDMRQKKFGVNGLVITNENNEANPTETAHIKFLSLSGTMQVYYADGTGENIPFANIKYDGQSLMTNTYYELSQVNKDKGRGNMVSFGEFTVDGTDENKSLVQMKLNKPCYLIQNPESGNTQPPIPADHARVAHLPNAEVLVKIDGAVTGIYNTDINGDFEILGFDDRDFTVMSVGLQYGHEVLCLPYTDERTMANGMWGRAVKVWLQVWNSTRDFEINGYSVPATDMPITLDQGVPMYTGNTETTGSNFDGDGLQMHITGNAPYPLNISGIFGTVEGNIR